MKGSEDLLLTFSTLGVEVAIIIFTTDIWRGEMGTNYTSTDIPGVLEQKTNEKKSQLYTYSSQGISVWSSLEDPSSSNHGNGRIKRQSQKGKERSSNESGLVKEGGRYGCQG